MNEWRPFDANWTVFGIVMFVAYLSVAWSCYGACRDWIRHPSRKRRGIRIMRRERAMWASLALIMFVGAFYRQFDVQNLVSGIGRGITKDGMWYSDRRSYQAVVLGTCGMILLLVATVLWSIIRKVNPLAKVACGATVMLFGLNIAKLISLHQIDAILYTGVGGANAANLSEVVSVTMIGIMAYSYRREVAVVKRR